MLVELFEYPTNDDWAEVRRRALVTIGKKKADIPTKSWKEKILKARHSPIRRLHFAFYIECPYWVSVHLVRHVHAQPYVKSQRNDRQSQYDRNKAPQDEMVCMIWDMNAEELITICNENDKEIFISLNKNMFNKDLEILEYTLLQLDNLKLNGILYYDIAIVNFKKNLKLVYT